MINTIRPVVLGSQSPRRAQLLTAAGFNVVKQLCSDCEEVMDPTETASQNVRRIAKEKAENIRQNHRVNELLITADTVVVRNGEILMKPRDQAEARAFMRSYSEASHEVCTGVCLSQGNQYQTFSSTTKVVFGPLREDEIEYYISGFEVMDKAGAYGIQDWLGITKVKSIEGSYTNIMGLPVHAVYEAILKWSL